MSYKDLEKSIKAALDAFAAEQAAKVAKKAAKKARKAANKRKARRPALYRPDAPIRHRVLVTLNLREELAGGELGELIEAEFIVETMSELEAEQNAIKSAKVKGYVWRGTVSVVKID